MHKYYFKITLELNRDYPSNSSMVNVKDFNKWLDSLVESKDLKGTDFNIIHSCALLSPRKEK